MDLLEVNSVFIDQVLEIFTLQQFCNHQAAHQSLRDIIDEAMRLFARRIEEFIERVEAGVTRPEALAVVVNGPRHAGSSLLRGFATLNEKPVHGFPL